jgi:hypothetical protein
MHTVTYSILLTYCRAGDRTQWPSFRAFTRGESTHTKDSPSGCFSAGSSPSSSALSCPASRASSCRALLAPLLLMPAGCASTSCRAFTTCCSTSAKWEILALAAASASGGVSDVLHSLLAHCRCRKVAASQLAPVATGSTWSRQCLVTLVGNSWTRERVVGRCSEAGALLLTGSHWPTRSAASAQTRQGDLSAWPPKGNAKGVLQSLSYT